MNAKDNKTASQQIDRYINELGDWRGKMLTRLRKLILEAAPELTHSLSRDSRCSSRSSTHLTGRPVMRAAIAASTM